MERRTAMTGTLQIESSDGEQRQFPAGSVLLVTDIAGTRGHKTRVIGEEKPMLEEIRKLGSQSRFNQRSCRISNAGKN